MKRYNWAVLTNAEIGRDEDFERWYNEVHVPDLLRVPGVVGVTRGKLAPFQTSPGPDGIAVVPTEKATLKYTYLALYIIETDDLKSVLQMVADRAGTSEMAMSDALSPDITTMCFEDITSVPARD